MYIVKDKDTQVACGIEGVSCTDEGFVEISLDNEVEVHLYASDVRTILKKWPNDMLVNFVRHNCEYDIIDGNLVARRR